MRVVPRAPVAAIVAAAVASCAGTALALEAAPLPKIASCAGAKGTTVKHTKLVRVFTTKTPSGATRYQACELGHQEVETIDRVSKGSSRKPEIKISGTLVATLMDGGVSWTNLDKGVSGSTGLGVGDAPASFEWAIAPNGTVAWIQRPKTGGAAVGKRERGEGYAKPQVLDADPGAGALADLKLTRTTISWTHGGKPRSSELAHPVEARWK